MKQQDYLIKIEETTSFLCKNSQIIEKSFSENNSAFSKEKMLEKIKNTINELMDLKAVITNEGLPITENFSYSSTNRIYSLPIRKLTEKETETFLHEFTESLVKIYNWFEGASLDKLIVYPRIRMNSVKTEVLQDLEKSCLLRLIGITFISDFESKPKQEREKETCETTETIVALVNEVGKQIINNSILNNDTLDALEAKLEESEPENPHTELPPQ